MEQILEKYNLDLSNCVSITRDNAANMKAAFDRASFTDIINFPCACHSLYLVAGQAYNVTAATANVVEQVDEVRIALSNSREKRELLTKMQKKHGLYLRVFHLPLQPVGGQCTKSLSSSQIIILRLRIASHPLCLSKTRRFATT